MSIKNEIGAFAWFEYFSKDWQSGSQFYSKLLNWTTSEIKVGEQNTTMFTAGDICFANTETPRESNTPNHWASYIAVDDINLACEKVTSLKGKVLKDPFEIPTIGHSAFVTDPVGTHFFLFTPENKNSDVSVTGDKHGQVSWVDLMVEDPKALIPFYSEMFNWKIDAGTNMNGSVYHCFEAAGKAVGGIFQRPENVPKMPPAWLPYFKVTDINKYTIEARNLGGTVAIEPTRIQDSGIFSGVNDPTGAFFYMYEDISVKQ